MQNLHFFDCNASFGRRKVVLPNSFYKKEDLLKHMDNYGIDRALVSHAYARELDPTDGNKMLQAEIEGNSRFSPLWVALPHHTNEFPAPEELISNMKSSNAKAITLLPTTDYFFSLSEWNCGELFSALESYNIPLFLSMSDLDPYLEKLYNILKDHPKMKLVLTNVTYRISRNLYPLMKLFPSLFVESSGIKGQDAIQDLCEVFGSHRVLFGTNMPVGSGSSAVAMVTYANISTSDKERIAHANLDELLGGVLL